MHRLIEEDVHVLPCTEPAIHGDNGCLDDAAHAHRRGLRDEHGHSCGEDVSSRGRHDAQEQVGLDARQGPRQDQVQNRTG